MDDGRALTVEVDQTLSHLVEDVSFNIQRNRLSLVRLHELPQATIHFLHYDHGQLGGGRGFVEQSKELHHVRVPQPTPSFAFSPESFL